MSNALYELALNLDIQQRIREEINTELKKSDGKITYESIKSMSYLDKVFKGISYLIIYEPFCKI